jgi:hypothetical protein
VTGKERGNPNARILKNLRIECPGTFYDTGRVVRNRRSGAQLGCCWTTIRFYYYCLFIYLVGKCTLRRPFGNGAVVH